MFTLLCNVTLTVLIKRCSLFLCLFKSGLPGACWDQQNGEEVALSRFWATASRGLAASALTLWNREATCCEKAQGGREATWRERSSHLLMSGVPESLQQLNTPPAGSMPWLLHWSGPMSLPAHLLWFPCITFTSQSQPGGPLTVLDRFVLFLLCHSAHASPSTGMGMYFSLQSNFPDR